MYNFESILQKSKDRAKKRMIEDVIFSESNAQPLYRMIKEYYDTFPYATNREVYEHFSDLFADINFQIARLPIIKEKTLAFNICKYLNRNDHERKEAYEKVIREEKRKGPKIYDEEVSYSSNKLSASRTLTITALSELRASKAEIPEDVRKNYERFFRQPRSVISNHRRTLDASAKRDFDILRDTFSDTEYTQFSLYLKRCEPEIENTLKEEYINSLSSIGEVFKRLGLLSAYSKSYENILSRLNIKDFNYPLEEDAEDSLSVEGLFEKENLKRLSLNQLSMLNTFWINRFTKEITNFNQSFFIVKNLGLLDKIKKAEPNKNTGHISIEVDDKALKDIYYKMSFLHEVTSIILDRFKEDREDIITEEVEDNDKIRLVRKFDAGPVLEELEDAIGEQYTEYFDRIQPYSQNSLYEDIEDYRVMENAMHNTYRAKDTNIIAILSNLYEEGFSQNWGIIRERGKQNSKMILISIDSSGLNMPTRFHVERDLVKDFLRARQDNTLIPIYDGEKDFEYYGEYIRTPLLMPICARQTRAINKAMLDDKHIFRNFIEHVSFFSTGKYPEHLKIDKVVKKKSGRKIVKRNPPKRYLDLSTDEEFVEIEKDKFVKVDKTVKSKEDKTHE